MSKNSALASLTANYTDSEDEDDEPELEINAPKSDILSGHGSSSPGTGSSVGVGQKNDYENTEEESSTKKRSLAASSGLVSYQDDAIDDDAVDDYDYSSDTATQDGVEAFNKKSLKEQGEKMETSDVENSPVVEPSENDESKKSSANESCPNSPEVKKVGRSRLPPPPPGKCSDELQARIALSYEKIKRGLDMNNYIQNNKNFRNPSIYEKLVKLCNIDELGTNYPPEIFNPYEWPESSFHDELAKVQKAEMERREKERKERTKVEFVSGTAKKISGTSSEPEPKRKTKWDQRGVMSTLLPVKPPVAALAPPITTTATGTKSTIINAFGSLPKKPKL